MSEAPTLAADEECRFCKNKPHRRIMIKGQYGFLAYDRHPASEGHFLVIPYRHFPDYFDINDEEREELRRLIAEGKNSRRPVSPRRL